MSRVQSEALLELHPSRVAASGRKLGPNLVPSFLSLSLLTLS